MTAAGTRRDTRVRTRSSEIPTFATFEAAVDRRPTCDGCGDPATWRGPVASGRGSCPDLRHAHTSPRGPGHGPWGLGRWRDHHGQQR